MRRVALAACAVAAAGFGAAGWVMQGAEAQAGADLAQGKAVYTHWCAPCHDPGPGHPGTQSLQFKYKGEPPAVLLERKDLTPDAVKLFVRQGVMSMANFRKTEITDAELSALAAYITHKE